MKQFSYTIVDPAGIHARPAGMLVKLLQTFSSDVTISCGEKSAGGKKLFAIMGMAVKSGETITVSATGDDEEAAAAAAEKFLKENL